MPQPTLLSIQIGKPQSYGSDSAISTHDKPWTTGFFKTPITGPIFVSKTNLAGDGQADLKHHGGIDKAILAYSADHYPKWKSEIHRDLPHGAFGENLTISNFTEDSVHIGDLFSIGSVVAQVSQPRQPCWKLARRWRMNELVAMVIQNGRTGWYLRVLTEGFIEPGLPVTLLDCPNPEWPISRANRILHHHKKDLDLTLQLASVPKLADAWIKELEERAAHLRQPSPV